MNYKNKIASLIFYSGIVYLLAVFFGGLFIGIMFQDSRLGILYTSGYNWVVMLAIWISGFMSSLLFFGGAEIIELLHQQNIKVAKDEYKIKREEPPVKRPEYQHSKYEDL